MPEPHAPHGLYEVFLRVAQDGSFTAAGRSLGYTQSAVSRQIQTLEDEWGSTLFDRLPRGVRLTAAGRALLPHAEAVRDRMRAARAELDALRSLGGGVLRVGAFAAADMTLVPRAVAQFRERHPDVCVQHTEGPTARHVALLAEGRLDVAVVSAPAGGPLSGPELHPLLEEPMYVALPRGHRFAGRRAPLRLAELADERWIEGDVRPEQTLLAPALAAGFRPAVAFRVNDWTAKQGFVAAGLGITVLPALAAAAVRPDLALVRVSRRDLPCRHVYAATPRGPSPTPAAEALLGMLREAAAALVP
ncbi:LysR substrate-binding domain-containing protein [Streptomyces sp. NRRL S-87]|uniref:LysR family transcriptional regulator n=1 Tax=Streptomyces sp. NRRL S-87 TaxID=1463920 RepID=UPI0004BFE66F|nr:LysR substrate-binding domain-containing protein [Streptomyces sp. NRRL S-87]